MKVINVSRRAFTDLLVASPSDPSLTASGNELWFRPAVNQESVGEPRRSRCIGMYDENLYNVTVYSCYSVQTKETVAPPVTPAACTRKLSWMIQRRQE